MRVSQLRKRIMEQRGVEFRKLSKRTVTVAELPTPFRKTPMMKYLELRFKASIESLIMQGNIYDLQKRLGVDATTVSKWRKAITKAREEEFWSNFN